MRWLFFDPTHAEEAAEHQRTIEKIDAWWQEFQKNTKRIDQLFRQQASWDLAGWMNEHLESIAEGLMWEFGPAVNSDGHRLVITPEAKNHLRPLAADVVARAPKIGGWEFYCWRLPDGAEMISEMVNARVGCSLDDVTVAITAGDENRIDLQFRWPDVPEDESEAMHAVVVAAETLLGEERLEKWVGLIEPLSDEQADESKLTFLPFDRAFETFEALRSSLVEQLPDVPWSTGTDDEQWAMMQREATAADDYAGRDDLMTCVTCNPNVVSASFGPRYFASERFGKNGEVFAYVKVDGSEPGEMTYGDREEMEAAVQVALEQENIGGLLGGGHGMRYSYVEFATLNMPRAIELISEALQKGKVPKRSWILFHDSSHLAEWVGIYPDTPEPPMAVVEDDEEDYDLDDE